MFAPAIGIEEDPVTGNGNGPLGAYLVKLGLLPVSDHRASFRSCQGEAMGRPGSINVEVAVKDDRPFAVKVSGRAVIVFKVNMVL
jgi:PhzF family phenazine biosynthesis protein